MRIFKNSSPGQKVSCKAILIVAALACVFPNVQAQVGSGAEYLARDPVTCETTRIRGASPTVEEATRLFLCANENESARWGLVLLSDVRLEIAAPRSSTLGGGLTFARVDTRAPLFDIRGSFTRYVCAKVGDPRAGMYPPGKNCSKYRYTYATGDCFKTKFGEWRCQMMDLSVRDDREIEVRDVPPPGYTAWAAQAASTPPPRP